MLNFLALARTLHGSSEEALNEDLLRQFASCAAGNISPMQAVIGGIAAQEVMKVSLDIFFILLYWFILFLAFNMCAVSRSESGVRDKFA